jgi:RNA polymerase primary sigma factor
MVVNLKSPTTDYFERTETLTRYYEDIRKYDVMSEEKEVEMFELFKNGNKQEQEYARNFIINANQRFVVAMAKRFATNENILDLISEGNIGLIEAMKDFDITKGNKFITFAVWYVRRAINNYCINYGNLVKKTNLSKTYHIIAQATNKFIQTEYRQPTLEELLEIVNKEHKADIKSIEDIIDTKISSIDEGFNSEDDDAVFGEMSLYNSYSSSFNEYEKISNDDFNNKLISSMLGKLPEREKTIIKMVFGIGYYREYELQEIAEELGLTTERVRQIKNSVIKEIKEKYKNVMSNM